MTAVANIRAGVPSALVAIVLTAGLAANGAMAESGGVGPGGGNGGGGNHGGNGNGNGGACKRAPFGERALERGDCGTDVETLNWLLRSRDYGVALEPRFAGRTHDSVRDFQGRRGLKRSGVVNAPTHDALVGGMGRQKASWYGPGFFGNRTACGQVLRRRTKGVAHRSLPCGTKVVIGYHGRFVRTRVIDRGPFVKRNYERDWDLTQATAERLRFDGVDRIRTAPLR